MLREQADADGVRRRDRSRRGQLQRLLGDVGEVLPRQSHGNPLRPAAGWYARMHASGEVVFLGDYESLASHRIVQLVSSEA
jgi:hypothetical protein